MVTPKWVESGLTYDPAASAPSFYTAVSHLLTGPVPYGSSHAVYTLFCKGTGKDTGTTPRGGKTEPEGARNTLTAAAGQPPVDSPPSIPVASCIQAPSCSPEDTQSPTPQLYQFALVEPLLLSPLVRI